MPVFLQICERGLFRIFSPHISSCYGPCILKKLPHKTCMPSLYRQLIVTLGLSSQRPASCHATLRHWNTVRVVLDINSLVVTITTAVIQQKTHKPFPVSLGIWCSSSVHVLSSRLCTTASRTTLNAAHNVEIRPKIAHKSTHSHCQTSGLCPYQTFSACCIQEGLLALQFLT